MGRTEYNKEYYQKHKERILKKNREYELRELAKEDSPLREKKRGYARAHQKKRKERHREIKREYLETPCVDCGIELPWQVMDFDHIHGEKLFNISQSFSKVYVTYEELRAEIEKCEVRCPNCHRMRHYLEKESDAVLNRQWNDYYLRITRGTGDRSVEELLRRIRS